jgi:uncharacterized cupredoxin-like copper-binding protein
MGTRYIAAVTAFTAAGILSLMVVLPAAAGPAAPAVKTVSVIAGKPSEFKFRLSVKTVPHGKVLFKLTNSGNLPHDLKLCSSPKGSLKNTCTGKASKLITPGTSTSLLVTFKVKGTYEYLCTVPGHAAAGMKGLLKVT